MEVDVSEIAGLYVSCVSLRNGRWRYKYLDRIMFGIACKFLASNMKFAVCHATKTLHTQIWIEYGYLV